MRALVTSDIHMNAKPDDSYRWGLFDWLYAQAVKNDTSMIVVAGDLTDAKDCHNAALVNRMVSGFAKLASHCEVHVLKANHDYLDPEWPFFGFLEQMDNVFYHKAPYACSMPWSASNGEALFLPSVKDTEEWRDLDLTIPNVIFAHQTFDGALSENGSTLQGVSPSIFAKISAKVWSGDIHVPQKVSSNIEYIGAPYRIKFGDIFEPRVLLMDGPKKTRDLHFPTVNKVLVELRPGSTRNPTKFMEKMDAYFGSRIKPGDHVKVRVHLARVEFDKWSKYRTEIIEYAKTQKVKLFGPELRRIADVAAPEGEEEAIKESSPEEVVRTFAAGVDDMNERTLDDGLSFLREAQR